MENKIYKIAIVVDPHLAERSYRCRKDNSFMVGMEKLEYIAERNDAVIITGDLFEIHHNSTLFFNSVHALFKKYQGKFHAIPGNHDTFKRNITNWNRTTLGSLYYTGVLDLHTKGWDLFGIHFEPCLVDQDPSTVPCDNNNSNILIAHKFFNNKFDPEESLTSDDIRLLNYNVAFLGHDHKPYPEAYVGSTAVIRMGSLTRKDTQVYNKDREICYYQITTDGSGEFDYERKVIPSKSTKECYLEEAYNHMCAQEETHKEVSFIQIGNILSKFTRKATGSNSLDATLHRIGTPQASIDDIKFKHELVGIQYT